MTLYDNIKFMRIKKNNEIKKYELKVPYESLNEDKKKLVNELWKKQEELNNVKGTECEVWSRVVGYFAPTKMYNPGKLQEYHEREVYDISNLSNNTKGDNNGKRQSAECRTKSTTECIASCPTNCPIDRQPDRTEERGIGITKITI